MNRILACLIVGCVLLLTACQVTPHAPPNRGQSGVRLDSTHDAPSELGSAALRSTDLVAATDRMAMDIASRIDVADRESPPRIYLGAIENHSYLRQQDYQVFLVRLRSTLNGSGARQGLEFIREREYIEQQREREFGDDHPDSMAEAYTSRADYVLTCEIFDLPSSGTSYYLLDYQLVQLRDAKTGPNAGAGAIVWENMYEVKFQ